MMRMNLTRAAESEDGEYDEEVDVDCAPSPSKSAPPSVALIE